MAKPIKSLQLYYPMIQFFIILLSLNLFMILCREKHNANASVSFYVPKNIVNYYGNRDLSRPKIYLTVILRGRAGYEVIYITNEAVGRVGYYQLISGKSEKNNCFSKFSSNSLDFFG